jgi:HD-GYP domain-containing protein (c-di-GMP phosphodiesterase class II)
MTSTRAYRGSLPEEIALKELTEDRGTQFDPAVVEVFLRIYSDMKARGVIKF